MTTEFNKIEPVIKALAELDPKTRESLFKLNYSDLKDLHGEELKKRISKQSCDQGMYDAIGLCSPPVGPT